MGEADSLGEIKSLLLEQARSQEEKKGAAMSKEQETETRIKVAENAIAETAKAKSALG
jgi:hypothetical protein